MNNAGEPNLRRIDERLLEARQRAAPFAGQWRPHGAHVIQGEDTVARCSSAEVAQHIADCHNHFLPLTNQLLFRERSEEDLNDPGGPAREIPTTARARRFPVPASRPRPAGTP